MLNNLSQGLDCCGLAGDDDDAAPVFARDPDEVLAGLGAGALCLSGDCEEAREGVFEVDAVLFCVNNDVRTGEERPAC